MTDGDTIRYRGEKIRLADIDTPEIFSPKCSNELELGRKARQRLIELLNTGPYDVIPTAGADEDIYGRKLRVVLHDRRSIGDTLTAEDLARRWLGSRLSWCDGTGIAAQQTLYALVASRRAFKIIPTMITAQAASRAK